MKYVIARSVGGSMGNSSKGQNFGKCTAEDKSYTDKNGVHWNQERVVGNLLVWGWEYTIANSYEEVQKVILKNNNCVVSSDLDIVEIKKYVRRRGFWDKIIRLNSENKSLVDVVELSDHFNIRVDKNKRRFIH